MLGYISVIKKYLLFHFDITMRNPIKKNHLLALLILLIGLNFAGLFVNVYLRGEGHSHPPHLHEVSSHHAEQGGVHSHGDGETFIYRYQIPLIICFASVFMALYAYIIFSRRERVVQQDIIRADQANQAKSDFLANMSHELRTPLNSILGLSRMFVEDEDLPMEKREMAEVIYKGAASLIEHVNDILDISKIESGLISLEHIGFDVRDVMSNVVQTMKPISESKNINLISFYHGKDDYFLLGDPFRIKIVLTNFISNAIKYMRDDDGEETRREIQLTTSIKDIPKSDRVLLYCAVKDTGIGIEKNKLDDIFDKFIQADLSTTRKYGGTGLGLSISKELIEMMGGEIGVDSEIGKGSTFWFRLILDKTDEVDEKARERIQVDRRKKVRSSQNASIPVAGARVLLAEDHELNKDFMRRLLSRMGFLSVDVVDTGTAAVDAFEKSDYDLILMDCHMPDKTGYEATRDIRSSKKETGASIPIVALTADAMKEARNKCFEVGMNGYLSKPVSLEDLQLMLSEWVIFNRVNDRKVPPLSGMVASKADNFDVEPKASAGGAYTNSVSADLPADLSLIEEYADTPKEKEHFIALFLQQSAEGLVQMTDNVTNGPNQVWVDAAHKFKGGAGMIGAHKLHALCVEAHQMKDVPQQKRRVIMDQIKEEFAALEKYLRDYMS